MTPEQIRTATANMVRPAICALAKGQVIIMQSTHPDFESAGPSICLGVIEGCADSMALMSKALVIAGDDGDDLSPQTLDPDLRELRDKLIEEVILFFTKHIKGAKESYDEASEKVEFAKRFHMN